MLSLAARWSSLASAPLAQAAAATMRRRAATSTAALRLKAYSTAVESEQEPAIVVTERCAQRINKLREDDPDLCLRVEVDGGGCQGFQYNFKLDKLGEIDAEVDKVFTVDGASLVIDETSLDLLKGSKVDYKSDLIGSAFVIGDNPHAGATCGCKRSFTIK